MPLVINALGADTQTHTDTHTDTRTKAISRNQAHTAKGRAPGLITLYVNPLTAKFFDTVYTCAEHIFYR